MSDLLSKYNANGALKIPMTLWIVLGYGLRHIALILFPPTRIAFETYSELFRGKIFLFPDALIVLVIILNMARQPEAGKTTRLLWSCSYWFVITAYLLDALFTLSTHNKAVFDTDHIYFNYLAAYLMIDLGIISYLMGSGTVKEVFKSFPKEPIAPEIPAVPKTQYVTQPTPIVRRTNNIPDPALISQAILPDYVLSGYPFPAGGTADPILRIRQHLTNNNLALAEKGLRYLLEQQPQNADYWHELALVAFAAEKLPQAEALILKAIIFDPNNYLYWRNLGEIRRRLGHFDNAIEDAQRAITLKPDDVNAYYNLGLALWDAGRNDEAMKAFQDAKQRHPDLQQTSTS